MTVLYEEDRTKTNRSLPYQACLECHLPRYDHHHTKIWFAYESTPIIQSQSIQNHDTYLILFTSFPILCAYAVWSFRSWVLLLILKKTSSPCADTTCYKEAKCQLCRYAKAWHQILISIYAHLDIDGCICVLSLRRNIVIRLPLRRGRPILFVVRHIS